MAKTTTNKRVKVVDLPEFDTARYLNSEVAIAAYLTDILGANDVSLLAPSLGDIARARGVTEITKSAGIRAKRCTKLSGWCRPALRYLIRVCGAGVKLVVEAV